MLVVQPGETLAVVGCGGKTTLVGALARERGEGAVLVMPTTKILPMHGIPLCSTLDACLAHQPQPGVQCLGVLNPDTGKLEAPPEAHWQQLAQGYGLVLMEADGSRGLPCKGWRDDEPVVPAFATRTLGVVTTAALGQPVGEDTVLNPDAFCHLTGLSLGDEITLDALADMVAAPGGMFKNRQGQAVLLVNRVEGMAQLKAAKALAQRIRVRHPKAVDLIYLGSAQDNQWVQIS